MSVVPRRSSTVSASSQLTTFPRGLLIKFSSLTPSHHRRKHLGTMSDYPRVLSVRRQIFHPLTSHIWLNHHLYLTRLLRLDHHYPRCIRPEALDLEPENRYALQNRAILIALFRLLQRHRACAGDRNQLGLPRIEVLTRYRLAHLPCVQSI